MHSTNYVHTLIAVAPDSNATAATPPRSTAKATVAERTFQMIHDAPYRYTSDDVIFTVYADRAGITEADRPAARAQFFSKGQPCLRCSDLGKKYGWGIHHDGEGRVALLPIEGEAYQRMLQEEGVKVVRAMRSAR